MSTAEISATAVLRCPGCGTEIGGSLPSCPVCHRLVHADRLKELAAEAVSAAERQDVIAELTAWRASLDLLPEGSRQYTTIASRVSELSRTDPTRKPTRVSKHPPGGGSGWQRSVRSACCSGSSSF